MTHVSTPVVDRDSLPRRPTYEQFARERYGLADDWKVFRWQAFGGTKENGHMSAGVMVTGAVVRETYKRGKRKGTPHWGKRLKETECSLPVNFSEYDAWMLMWGRETGLCFRCEGTGQQWHGWNHINGNKYRECTRCHGSGRAQGMEAPSGGETREARFDPKDESPAPQSGDAPHKDLAS